MEKVTKQSRKRKMETVKDEVKLATQQPESKESLINALKQDFATTVNKIYINSLKREVGFREITVLEQKTLSRVMIDNDSKNRKDVVYDAQCAIINKACLEPDFDIYQLSEFDRLKLLIALYQANMFKNDIRFTCEECGADNQYKLDFNNVLKKLDEVELVEKEFEYENRNFSFKFKIEYPSVQRVLQFYKGYSQKYRNARKTEIKSLDNAANIDYVNLFIKTIDFTNKANGQSKKINMLSYPAIDVEDVLSAFPQDVLYSEAGAIKFIVEQFVKKVNDSFDVHECYNCGAKHTNVVSSADSFL